MAKLARFVPTFKLKQYDVVNKQHQDMGQVQTLVMDMQEGLIAFVLVAFGGTLGFGDKWFAIPWDALQWHAEKMKFILDMPEEVLKNAPGMHKDKWLQEIEQWQKEEDLAHIDNYYIQHGYKSYIGIVRTRRVLNADRQAKTMTVVAVESPASITPVVAAEIPASSVTITQDEAYFPIKTQHTMVARVKAKDGSLVAGTSVEWILNRVPGAVGDIVSLEGNSPQKINNTFGIVKTDSNGEARLTITSVGEGDTYITAYVPGIGDPAAHKQFVVKSWLDITARFPNNAINAIGTKHVLAVQTIKVGDGTAVGNVPVRFTIVGNTPGASFKETHPASTTYTINTDPYGFAAATLQQVTPVQGTNTVRIDVLAQPNSDFVLLTKDITNQWQATKLGLNNAGPEQITLLGQATYNIKIDNTGDLAATGVILTDEIPLGMSYVSADPAGTVSGGTVSWNVVSLTKGMSRSFKLVLRGTQAGLWTNTVVATSKEVGTATAQATTRVLPEPEVVIKETGPSGVFTGFTRSYTLSVTNTGSVALSDVVVKDQLHELLSYKSSTPAGSVTGNQIAWNLGTLGIAETKKIVIILGGVKSGKAINKATVITREGATSTDSLNITVLGAPGAHMWLTGSSDPAAIGDAITYTIKVINQSLSNALHNLTVEGLVPIEMVFVSADGPTAFTVKGQGVLFAPLAELKPEETVELHINVKATAAGSAVFNAAMHWDEFKETIVNQEGTTVFKPQQ